MAKSPTYKLVVRTEKAFLTRAWEWVQGFVESVYEGAWEFLKDFLHDILDDALKHLWHFFVAFAKAPLKLAGHFRDEITHFVHELAKSITTPFGSHSFTFNVVAVIWQFVIWAFGLAFNAALPFTPPAFA